MKQQVKKKSPYHSFNCCQSEVSLKVETGLKMKVDLKKDSPVLSLQI